MDLAFTVQKVLNEKRMLLLSALTVPGALIQLLRLASPEQSLVIDVADWVVISIFGIEYVVKFYSAPSTSQYVTDRWNLLNLLIILLAIGGAVTSSPPLYSAPLLRLFRATRLLTESGRSSLELGHEHLTAEEQ